jgi:photosystem II stability/assembly factor-like uncharacterized protein
MKCIFFFTLFLFIRISELQSQNLWQNPDGGQWETIDSLGLEEFNLPKVMPSYRSIECIDSNNWVGLASDNPDSPIIVLIRKTEDGGKTWKNIYTAVKKLFPVLTISYPYKNTIICGCDSGYILKTIDDGINWEMKRLPENACSFRIKQLKMFGDIGVAMCNNGNLYLTEDCGENWKNLPVTTDSVIKGVSYFSMPDEDNIFIAGAEVIVPYENLIWKYFSSSDRGKSWKYLTQTKNGNYDSFYHINFVTKNKGWGFASKTTSSGPGYNWSQPHIFITEDGGQHWSLQYRDTVPVFCNLITPSTFADSLHGIVLAPFQVFLTSDGGNRWIRYDLTYDNLIRTSFGVVGAYPTLDRPIFSTGTTLLRKKATPVSVNESPVIADGFIFPNPAGDQIEIRLDDTYRGFRIEVYSSEGVIVIECEFAENLDISNLSTGLYFIRIGNKFDKFIKL